MNLLLLDTSAYSAFKRGHSDIVQTMQQAERIYLNPIALAELPAGFSHGNRARQNEGDLLSFLCRARVDVISIDENTSVFYAAIYSGLRRSGTMIPTNDVWIAASAMQHGLCVLTTDSHFNSVQ